MSSKNITPHKGNFVDEFVLRVKLVLRLLKDRRVSPFLKLLPFSTVLYFVFFPDLLPGPIDDLTFVLLGSVLFIELSPQEIVDEHMKDLRKVLPGEWKEPEKKEDIIDAGFKEVTKDEGDQSGQE